MLKIIFTLFLLPFCYGYVNDTKCNDGEIYLLIYWWFEEKLWTIQWWPMDLDDKKTSHPTRYSTFNYFQLCFLLARVKHLNITRYLRNNKIEIGVEFKVELVSKELNHLAAILHIFLLLFFKKKREILLIIFIVKSL